MHALWLLFAGWTVFAAVEAFIKLDPLKPVIAELRYVRDDTYRPVIPRYNKPRDPYTNSQYSYGEDDSYGTSYPQYGYKPYEGDCNNQMYDEYGQYLADFKGEWYDNEKYQEYTIKADSKEDQYWEQYAPPVVYKPDFEYPVYDDSVDIKPRKPGPCCHTFKAKKLPTRKHFAKDEIKRGRKRKEYRQLTDDERNTFHAALNTLKGDGTYDLFVKMHRQSNSPYAHNGASFGPWHREYLFRLENALTAINKSISLPYWDSSLDESLPNPADSAIWTKDFLGNLNGPVTQGDFAGWDSIPDCDPIFPELYRNGVNGIWGQCLLFSEFDLQYVFKKKCFRDITCNTDCKFEADHAGVHTFIGGHMGNPTCAPSDPVFFLHHAFVDCVWEEFRQEHQESPIYLEYPSQVNGDNVGTPPTAWSPNGFEWHAPMRPFTISTSSLPSGSSPYLWNGHGIGKWYQKYYKCVQRPSAINCNSDADCGGNLLWCDIDSFGDGKCRGKVKLGGNCAGLPDNACSNHECPTVCMTNVCRCI